MNLKLEELRRRLLEPVAGKPSQSTSVYKRSSADLVVVNHKLNEAVAESKELKVPAPAIEPGGTGLYQPPVAPKIVEGKVFAASTPTNIREAALRYAENATAETSAGEDSMESNSQYQVAQAVSKVFEQVKAFEDRFVELTKTFEPVEALAQSAAKFAPLRTFQEQLAQLSRSFEPMRVFQVQLAELAQSFAPMKGLQNQLAQLSDAFEININQLGRSLEPAKEFQAQLIKLARAFEPATELADDFAVLADTFRGESGAQLNGVAPAVAVAQPDLQH
jgi:hypothetical protein